jgi:LEA14-like dessication related protein
LTFSERRILAKHLMTIPTLGTETQAALTRTAADRAWRRGFTKQIARILALLMVLACPSLGRTDKTAKPKIELKRISLEEIDWAKKTANTKMAIQIENPGPAFTVKEVSYRLRLNEKQAGEGRSDKEIVVPANGSVTVELPFTVSLSELPDVAWSTISTGFNIHYEMETEFVVPAIAFLTPRIKTSFSGDLSPSVKLSSWSDKLRERISSKP